MIPVTHGGEQRGEIIKLLRNHMDDVALALETTAYLHHRSAQRHLAIFFEQLRPSYHQIGDAGFILQGDAHNAHGGTGLLPDERDASEIDPTAILKIGQVHSAHHPAPLQLGARERYGMRAQRQPSGAIILHHLLALLHLGQIHHRLDRLCLELAHLWRMSDEWKPVYSGAMTDCNEVIRPVHDRIPILLHVGDYDRWLGGSFDELLGFQQCCFLDDLIAIRQSEEPWSEPRAANLLLSEPDRTFLQPDSCAANPTSLSARTHLPPSGKCTILRRNLAGDGPCFCRGRGRKMIRPSI